MPDPEPPRPAPDEFESTSWSLVLAAAGEASARARAALEALCRRYWFPLYTYLRRRGQTHHAAEDLTQGFFEMLLRREDLTAVRAERGRFRSFLLAALRHYVIDQADRARAARRGGGRAPLPLEFDVADARYAREPSHDLTPERAFDRRWALAVLGEAREALRAEYAAEGHGALFDALSGRLGGDAEGGSDGDPSAGGGDANAYATVAARLGMTPGAVKVAAHRLRRRFRAAVRSAVGRTVHSEADIDDELAHLLGALRAS